MSAPPASGMTSTPTDPFARELQWLLEENELDLGALAPTSVDPVHVVQELLDRAVRSGVSDLHFEPHEQGLRVRFRLDGILKIVQEIPSQMKAEVLSRIKVMASMDIAEK